MDFPSPVSLVQRCRSEFSDSVELGVFMQSVYVRGVRFSSLSFSVLWLPQHKLLCLLLFVSNTMPSYPHSSFPDLARNFWKATVQIFICNMVPPRNVWCCAKRSSIGTINLLFWTFG